MIESRMTTSSVGRLTRSPSESRPAFRTSASSFTSMSACSTRMFRELDRPPPSLDCHYSSFIATAKWSAPDRSISTFCLAFLRLSIFPLHLRSGSQVPYESLNESHAPYTPDAVWPVHRFPPD